MSVRTRYLATTLALLVIAGAVTALQRRAAAPTRLPERHGESTLPALAPRRPVARQILERRAELGLTPAQVQRLGVLNERWVEETRALEAEATAAGEELERSLAAVPSGRGVSLAELQRRSAPFRELSAELRRRRDLHADAAADVLTAAQRERLAEVLKPGDRR